MDSPSSFSFPLSPSPPPLRCPGLGLRRADAGIGVAGNEGASRANPEPELSLEVMHPCWLDPGLPLTAVCTCTFLLSHTAAPTPGLSHTRIYAQTRPCTLNHVNNCRVMMEEVMVTSHPKLPHLKAARGGDSRGQPPSQGEDPVSECYGQLHRQVCPELFHRALLLLILLGTSPPTASFSPGQGWNVSGS